MKILLTLPLLLLFGCALAEDIVSTSTSNICTNSHCIDCVNGVCKEYRAKGEDSANKPDCTIWPWLKGCYDKKRETSEEGSSSTNCNTVNGHKTCVICDNGVCHTKTDKRETNCNICPQCCPPYEPRSKRELPNNQFNMPNCFSYPNDPRCNRNHGIPHLPDCFHFPDHPACKNLGNKPNCDLGSNDVRCRDNQGIPHLPDCFHFPDHPACKNLGNHDTIRNLPNCFAYPNDPRCNRNHGIPNVPNCFKYPNDARCQQHNNNHLENNQFNMPNCFSYPNDPRCHRNQGIPNLPNCFEYPNHPACANIRNDQFNMPDCYHYPNDPRCHYGKREAGVYSKNCINGHCQECTNGHCRDVKNRKREEQNESSSSNCFNGQCTTCVNGTCSSFQQ